MLNSHNRATLKWTDDKLEELRLEAASGLTRIQLGEKYGMSATRVCNLMKKAKRNAALKTLGMLS